VQQGRGLHVWSRGVAGVTVGHQEEEELGPGARLTVMKEGQRLSGPGGNSSSLISGLWLGKKIIQN